MRSGLHATLSSGRASRQKLRPGIIELGKALVAQLGLEQSNDVLGRWMAHHLARLIEAVETAPPESRPAAEDRCFDAVLEVWRHRNCLPQGHRPFEPAERLLETVAALDPEAPRPVYTKLIFDWIDQEERERPTPVETQRLDIVRQFDRAARHVIEYLLAHAAEDLPDETREWVKLAQKAGMDDPDARVIRVLLQSSDEFRQLGQDLEDRQVARLASRVEELERFLGTTITVRDELAARLADAEAKRDARADKDT